MSLTLTLAALLLAAGAHAQAAPKFPTHATHYDVEATLRPADQTLSARAKVEFVADAPTRTIVVELHRDLKVSAVKNAKGKALEFDRDPNIPLNVRVNLPDALVAGNTTALTFEYAGPVSLDEDSPTKGVRLASIDKEGAYLLLPSRWFPLTNYPSNRYTYDFKITVPDTFAVVGTGKADSPNMIPAAAAGAQGQAVYAFHSDRPSPGGTFVAGNLQLNPAKIEGFSIAVYAPPAQAGTANAYAETLTHAVTYFSDVFGPLPQRDFKIAQLPDGSVGGFAAPGLILISARQWSPKPNERLLAQLVADQWWNDSVLPASPADVWVSDGLAAYSGALYAEESEGESGLRHALDDFAVGTLMYEDAAPISQAQRLQPFSDDYRSVVEDKGAIVFHMLHTQLGDAPFRALLKDFYTKYAGRVATLADFEKLTEAIHPAKAATAGQPSLNLVAFFSQWVNSTGIPEFKLEYIVYRTKKGFKVVGKVNQDLDTFRMPVEVRVDTEGNPEYKTINIAGTASPFVIETFGRPKPNGITLDPNNNLLKASPRLRIRAAIARGEGLALQAKYYDAIQEYQHALDLQSNNSLAHFRIGEAMFYQKNYQAAANAFRSALDGDLDASYKWVEVWSHIYIGKIYDLTGQRERAVNEYSRAQHLGDDTGGAQAEAERYLKKPYSEEPVTAAAAK
ncbi:MAG: M1 family aminopeptidase [Candidatus Acidiferrales bacterium]